MNCTTIKYHKLKENATVPTQGSVYAAGYDLYACLDEPKVVFPNGVAKIGTGLSFELPEGTFAGIYARSGLATKQGLRPANCVGVCDSDYRGEYIVAVFNDSTVSRTINPGDRIAQMIVQEYVPLKFEEAELTETDRGNGGFGSTGK